jgi:hypothetical protein
MMMDESMLSVDKDDSRTRGDDNGDTTQAELLRLRVEASGVSHSVLHLTLSCMVT